MMTSVGDQPNSGGCFQRAKIERLTVAGPTWDGPPLGLPGSRSQSRLGLVEQLLSTSVDYLAHSERASVRPNNRLTRSDSV
jgi:hypothetical protein